MLHFSGVPGSVRLTRAGSVAAVRSLFQMASSVSLSAIAGLMETGRHARTGSSYWTSGVIG